MRALETVAGLIDAVNGTIGRAVRWLVIGVVLVQLTVVVLRYAYGSSFVWMQESVLYLHATVIMLTVAYAFLVDAHVRVDLFYSNWSVRGQAWCDLAGVITTVWPFCGLVVWASWSYVSLSWRLNEGPMQVGGLPLQPWLKALIPTMAILLALQGLSVAIRAILVIAGRADTLFPARGAKVDAG